MNASIANHLSDELKLILPMWSEVCASFSDGGDLILIVSIPAKRHGQLHYAPAFRLVMPRQGGHSNGRAARVDFVGGWGGGVGSMAEVFNPQRVLMEDLKTRLEKFWCGASTLMFYARED